MKIILSLIAAIFSLASSQIAFAGSVECRADTVNALRQPQTKQQAETMVKSNGMEITRLSQKAFVLQEIFAEMTAATANIDKNSSDVNLAYFGGQIAMKDIVATEHKKMVPCIAEINRITALIKTSEK